MKIFKKTLSVFLAFVMVLTVIPISVYAAESEEPTKIEVQELEAYRDEYSKTFETSEGTNVVISAAVPIHYENGGELVEIDNTLITSDNDNSMLTNKDNSYSVELPKKYKDDSTITLSSDENEISFSILNDVNKSKGVKSEVDEIEIDKTDAESVAYAESNLDKLSSSITYSDVIENTDIEYVVESNQLKENIVINDVVDENYSVSYELNLGNLIAVKNDDNSISIKDADNKEIYLIESPYMYDANDNVSYDINVDLTKSNDVYVLTYTPDYAWLSSENCAYPVIVDPTVTIVENRNYQNIKDAYYSQYYSTNYNDDEAIIIQNDSDDICTGFYQFLSFPNIPNDCKIINSKFHIFLIYDSDNENELDNSISAFMLENDSLDDIDDIDYQIINSINTTTNNPIEVEYSESLGESEFCFDITKATSMWQQNNVENKILYMKNTFQNVSPIAFASVESGYNELMPYISIEYKSINGINNHYNYTVNDINMAGKSYINEYTGQLIVERTDLFSNGSIGDITFYSGNNCNVPDNSFMGQNVSMNYFKTLELNPVNSSEYIITNGDGSKCYSSEMDSFSVNASSETISISYVENGNTFSESYIANSKTTNLSNNGNKYILNKISVLKDNSSVAKEVNITYTNSHITQISDEICKLTISYRSNAIYRLRKQSLTHDDVVSINANDSPKDISLYYSHNGDYYNVQFGNTQNIQTYINSSGYVTKIVDEFGGYYEYEYNDAGQVISVKEFSSNGDVGNTTTFEYGVNTTIISDGTNTFTEYFDNNGNLLSTIDQDGNAVFNRYDNGLITQTSKIRNSSNYIADFYGFESSDDSFIQLNSNTKVLDDSVKFNGEKSLKLTCNANRRATYGGTIGGLDENTTYTVSMWINNSNNATYDFTLSNDSGIIEDFEIIESIENWHRYCCTLNTEESNWLEVELKVDNRSNNTADIIYLDNAYVQKSTAVTAINLIDNGEFSDSTSTRWQLSSNASLIVNEEDLPTADNECLRINGIYSGTNVASQRISLSNIRENDKYVFGAWVKAINALPAKEGYNREFTVSVYPVISGSTASEPLKTITYSTDNSYWQYIEEELILNSDTISNLNYLNGIEIKISYNYQMGYALIDGVSLLKDELYNIEFEYDNNNEIQDILIDGESISEDELSDEEGEDVSQTSPNVDYEYDEYGNLIKSVSSITVNDNTESLLSKYTYGNQGTLLTSSLNRLGYKTKYGYDYFGNVAAVTDANQLYRINEPTEGDENDSESEPELIPTNYCTTYYQYDNFQNLASIINTFEKGDLDASSDNTTTLNVKYTYNGSRIHSIETINDRDSNDENTLETSTNSIYIFRYDPWGNLTRIYAEKLINNEPFSEESLDTKVPYIQYEYDSVNYHQLNSVSYINGQKINYMYDSNGNVTYMYDTDSRNGDTLACSYFYLDDGTCYAKKDLKSGTVETYSNNTTTLRDSNGVVIHSYSYDSNGNTVEKIGSNTVSSYSQEINNGTNHITNVNGSENILYSKYDDLGRITEEHFSSGSDNSYISREYTYFKESDDANENETSNSIMQDIAETYGENDPEFNSSELPRYITYYSVNSLEEKTKLFEYRYIYYPNEEIYAYTLVSDGDEAVEGVTTNENINQVSLIGYNSANMINTSLDLYLNNTSSNNPQSSSYSSNSSGFLNRLIEAINVSLGAIGNYLEENSSSYYYDSNGNILDGQHGSSVTFYTYDEATSNSNISNCLTGIHIGNGDNPENISISYDELGNVNKVDVSDASSVNYNGIIDSVNLNWSRGNTLDNIYLKSRPFLGLVSANVKVLDYKYNDNNLRTHKRIDLGSQLSYLFGADAITNADIEYIWNGNTLVGENIDCSGSIFNEFSGADQINEAGKFNIVILYDDKGDAYGIVVNKTEDAYGNTLTDDNEEKTNVYYYLKDADNTITGLMDKDGNLVVSYKYDTFGTAAPDHAPGYKYLMLLNPLAYKDYIYDYETGMYYLQSRYYAPFVGRFISADNMLDTGSGTAMCTNAYVYCENDPINSVDPSGELKISSRTYSLKNKVYSLNVSFSIPVKTLAMTCSVSGVALDILGFINMVIPEPFLTKGVSITTAASGILVSTIGIILSTNKYANKIAYFTMKMSGNIKTSFTHYAIYTNKLKFNLFYLNKICFINSLSLSYVIK